MELNYTNILAFSTFDDIGNLTFKFSFLSTFINVKFNFITVQRFVDIVGSYKNIFIKIFTDDVTRTSCGHVQFSYMVFCIDNCFVLATFYFFDFLLREQLVKFFDYLVSTAGISYLKFSGYLFIVEGLVSIFS